MQNFGKILKEIRTNKFEMKQNEFADFIGIKQSLMSSYEIGRSAPSLDTLELIADKCECSIDFLLGRKTSEIDKYTITNMCDLFNTMLMLDSAGLNLQYEDEMLTIGIDDTVFIAIFKEWIAMKSKLKNGKINNDEYSKWITDTRWRCLGFPWNN